VTVRDSTSSPLRYRGSTTKDTKIEKIAPEDRAKGFATVHTDVEVSSFLISSSISYEKRFQSWRYEKEEIKAMKRVHLADKGVDPV
jgi:hypothetical protein